MVDVVVPVYRDVAMTEACLRRTVETAGTLLGQLLVVDDASPEPGMRPMLERLAGEFPALSVLHNDANVGFVRSANRGLSLRRGDVVLLNSDTLPTPGWLEELHAVASLSDQVAAVVPLSNNATLCSVPAFGEEARAGDVPWEQLGLQGAAPRTTEMPTGVGFCLYLSHRALCLLGQLDTSYGRGYHEENDWCARARKAGLRVLRANRAFVYHLGSVSFGAERARLDVENERRLVGRYPDYLDACRRFSDSPEAHAAALRAHLRLRGPLVLGVWGGGSGSVPAAALAGEGVSCVGALDGGFRPHVLHVEAPVKDRAGLAALLSRGAHLVLGGGALLEAARRGGGAWACTELLAGAAQAVTVQTEAEEQEVRRRFPLAAARVARVPGWAPPWRGAGAAPGRFFHAHVEAASEGLVSWLLAAYARYRAEARSEALPLRLSGPLGGRAPGPPPQGVSFGEAPEELPLLSVWLRVDAAWPTGALDVLASGGRVAAVRLGAAPEALGDAASWVEAGDARGLAQLLADAAAGLPGPDARAQLERLPEGVAARALVQLCGRVVDAPDAAPLRAHAHLRELLCVR